MTRPETVVTELDMKELEDLLERVRATLGEEEYRKLKSVVETLGYVTNLLEDRKTTIQRLRQLLFGASTEKTRDILKNLSARAEDTQDSQQQAASGPDPQEKKKPDGHGRNAAASYTGATKIKVRHETLKPGDCCPDCQKGKLHGSVEPLYLVRIVGQAPLGATVFEIQQLRCNTCLKIFPAKEPEGVGKEKYDETSGSMIALLKYGSGVPLNRIQKLQRIMGIPLPTSTQWDILKEVGSALEPAFQELIRQAAQGTVLHNDDTTMTVLGLIKKPLSGQKGSTKSRDPDDRSGVFTSGIVSTSEGRQIALFFTGHKHAGENLADVLTRRASDLPPPIQMCDALSRNAPAEFEVVLGNCIAHGRRKFVDVVQCFPQECRFVLETLRDVYHHDEIAKQQAMSPQQRLTFHQDQSGPLMEKLKEWLKEQFDQRKVEPNSGLGKAISYMTKHWQKLTLFLRVPGAPLDNNIAERSLKKAILHRKSALFYKTTNGAHVGDVFMSLIHTCELSTADPFDYLTQMQRHSKEMITSPADWMPWNYRETIERITLSPEQPPTLTP